jgi:nicotinamide phosphoribosyltransferase
MGYKTLNQRVGLIYGDSITPERMIAICSRLADKGYASDNLVYGIGSYTFQYQTRDTLGWAMKATYVELDGIGEEIFKDPITDSGTKRSAKGLLRVDLDENGNTVLKDQCTQEEAEGGLLQRVFLNGALVRPTTLAQIREKFLSQ